MTVDLTQDRALLDAFRRGERAALERVYRAHVKEVVATLRHGFVAGSARVSGLTDLDLALDLSQDVFLRAFSDKGRKSYDGLRPYGPYLRRIAKNLLIDRLRKSGREVPLDADQAAEVPEIAPAPEQTLDQKRLQEATQAFLATQNDEIRRFVELRFVQEKSQYEVLEAMGITRRRVRTLERRALDGLKAFLAERGLP